MSKHAIVELATIAAKEGASDIHLESGGNVFYRIDGVLERFDSGMDPSLVAMSLAEVWPSLIDDLKAGGGSVDRSGLLGTVRVRANISDTLNGLSCVMRIVPDTPPTPESLGIPERIQNLMSMPSGLVLFTGQFGSGKLLTLDTPIPTPSGWTAMGDLGVGDEVLGRDGRPCQVTYLSPINPGPELYRVTFDDGQCILADADHQWVVTCHRDRLATSHPNRRAAIAAYERGQQHADAIDALARQYSDYATIGLRELTELISARFPDLGLTSQGGMRAALDAVDTPYEMVTAARPRRVNVSKTETTVGRYVWDTTAVLSVNHMHWAGVGVLRAELANQATDLGKLVLSGSRPRSASMTEIASWFGGKSTTVLAKEMSKTARRAGLTYRRVFERATMKPSQHYRRVRCETRQYSTSIALKALALRIRQRYSIRPVGEAVEKVMMTREMLADGVQVQMSPTHRQTNFATHVSRPLDLPSAELPVDPYVLGAWLGDGTTGSGGFTGIDTQITDAIENAGYSVRHNPDDPKAHYIRGLTTGLRAAGVFNDKHIPLAYLRSSLVQRRSTLQGLMDTDGTIDKSGACELTLCNERLALDALELIRSLGIKASMTSRAAGITEVDPDNPGRKRRRVTGTRWRINFTTCEPVFRLSRKVERLPSSVRRTQERLYITSIKPIPASPGRCIQVDSLDSTYLAAGFVPTHNTSALAALVGKVNHERPAHILCLEEPTEFVHRPDLARISQREIGTHIGSWYDGIRAARRSDPDILMVGELREPEAVEATMAAAASGILVLATLHAGSTTEALTALLAMVGDERRNLVQTQLGQSLRAIITQQLLPRLCPACHGQPAGSCANCAGLGTKGRIAAREILIGTDTIRSQVMGGNFSQINATIESGRDEGMWLMRTDLVSLVLAGQVSTDDALEHSVEPARLAGDIERARARTAAA